MGVKAEVVAGVAAALEEKCDDVSDTVHMDSRVAATSARHAFRTIASRGHRAGFGLGGAGGGLRRYAG
jgi:hypothetical protein